MNSIVKTLAAVLALALCLSACARPAPTPKPDEKAGRHEYRDLKAEVFPVPAAVKAALPGLQNDNIYLYREIAPTLNLVAYVPDYSREAALRMAAAAFVALTDDPEFRRDIQFWIIQIQPQPPEKPAADQKPGPVLVWGVRPEEADRYKSNPDLAAFVRDSEYLLVDDRIIEKGDTRLAEFQTVAPEPVPGSTAAPLPGATAAAGATVPAAPPGPPPLVPPPGTEIVIPRDANAPVPQPAPAPGAPPKPVMPE